MSPTFLPSFSLCLRRSKRVGCTRDRKNLTGPLPRTVIGESVEVSQLLHWEVTELDATGSVKGLMM